MKNEAHSNASRPELYVWDPPFVSLTEAVGWIIQTRFSKLCDEKPAQANNASCEALRSALLERRLTAYGSIDCSAVSEIEPWAWTDLRIWPLRQNGQLLIDFRDNDLDGTYAVLSEMAYPASALKNLSRRSEQFWEDANGRQDGYLRVVDFVVFYAAELLKAFPETPGAPSPARTSNRFSTYEDLLKKLEEGKYLSDRRGLSIAEIARKVFDMLNRETGKCRMSLATISKGLSRHYDSLGAERPDNS